MAAFHETSMLNVLNINAASLYNIRDELHALVNVLAWDVLADSET